MDDPFGPSNFIKIDGENLTGNVATNLFAKSPRGRQVEVGMLSAPEHRHMKLMLNLGFRRWHADVYPFDGQRLTNEILDGLYRVIPDDEMNDDERHHREPK